MDINDKQFLAEGRVSHVYLLKDKRVLKLAHDSVPVEKVEDEFRRCQIVSDMGMSSPRALEILEVEGRQGIIFEWAGDEDLLKAKLGNPLNVGWGGRFMADAHMDLVNHKTELLPDIKEEALRLSRQLPNGTVQDSQQPILEQYLSQLPGGNHICHLDFHPGNIMLNANDYQIIDWGEAVKGPPEADFAMTSLVLSMAETSPGTGFILRILIPIFRKAFARAYRTHLLSNFVDLTEEKIERWTLAAAIFRLGLWNIDSERRYLTEIIQDKIKNLV